MVNRSKNWCFTIFNKPQITLTKWNARYIIYGQEICPKTNKEHLQGYAQFNKTMTLNQLKTINKEAHWEKQKGTTDENIKYCSKDGKTTILGEPIKQGSCQDKFKTAVTLMKQNEPWEKILEECGYAMLRYKRQIEETIKEIKNQESKNKIAVKHHTFHKWQEKLFEMINTKPNEREIIWIWDKEGNTGKSWMRNYIIEQFHLILFDSTNQKDVSYAYNNSKIVIFDLARHQKDHVNYGIFECIKNGRMFSGKYDSKMKKFDIPHLIIFANYEPDKEKLSKDRWNIKQIINLNFV